MPGLWIVAGPNGSGKSTLTASFVRGKIANLIDPDAIARRLNPENPTRSAIAAGREAIIQCQLLLQRRGSFVVETTMSGNGTIALMRQAPAAIMLANKALVIDNSWLRPRRLLLFRLGRPVWQSQDLPKWARGIRGAVASASLAV